MALLSPERLLISRRRSLLAIGSSPFYLLAPTACSGGTISGGSSGASATGGIGGVGPTGGYGAVAGYGAMGGSGGSAGTGSSGGAAGAFGGYVVEPPPCVNPTADAGVCAATPTGIRIGLPCDFAAFHIQPAARPDMFESSLIGRDDLGFFARAAVCTHQGCNVATGTLVEEGIRCPCHGSLYDNYGRVFPDQPAKKNLRAVSLALGCDGTFYVDLETTVDPALRLVVPT